MSGKLFAVVVIVIALASAVPILNHTFMGANVSMPEDISTHGHEIDKQIDETMIEAGLSFLAAQLVLGFFVWKTAGKRFIFNRDRVTRCRFRCRRDSLPFIFAMPDPTGSSVDCIRRRSTKGI